MSIEPSRRSFIFGSAAALALLAIPKPAISIAQLMGSGDRIVKRFTFSTGGGDRSLLVRLSVGDDLVFVAGMAPKHKFHWYLEQGMMLRGNQHLDIDVDRFDGDALASITCLNCDSGKHVIQGFFFKDGDRRATLV